MTDDLQIWAARLGPDGAREIVRLNQGRARTFDADVSAGLLMCPIPGCPSPRFAVRNCAPSGRRDHFFHVDGLTEAHAPESLEHYLAKHALAERLVQLLPANWTVSVDDAALDNGQRPDVNVYEDGVLRVACEVQYSPITPTEWVDRQQGYSASGVRGWWFFAGAHTSSLSFDGLHRALLHAGHPLLFVDAQIPDYVKLGAGTGSILLEEYAKGGDGSNLTTFSIEWSPLASADQTEGRLYSESHRRVIEQAKDLNRGLEATYRSFCERTGRAMRPGQQKMIASTTRRIMHGGHLAVEAPTGTGKGFAYLLPALAMNRRTLISTSSKVLQNQLVDTDIPAMYDALGKTGMPALLQGVSNYLCADRVATHEGPVPVEITTWMDTTDTGNRREIEVDEETWTSISTTSEACLRYSCDFIETCFSQAARHRASEAPVVVVNHDYLVQRMRSPDWLAEFDVVVIDEAHDLPQKALKALERTLSVRSLRTLAQQARSVSASAMLAHGLDAVAGRLQDYLSTDGDVAVAASIANALEGAASRLAASITIDDKPSRQKALQERIQRALLARADTARLLASPPDGWVTYVRQGPHQKELVIGPTDASSHLSTLLSSRTVLFTSATLAPLDDFSPYLVSVAGRAADTIECLRVASPYDLAEQVRVYLPDLGAVPSPKSEPTAHAEAVDRVTAELVDASGGGALVLTTSNLARDRIAAHLRASTEHRILVQGESSSLEDLIEELKADESSVLVVTRSGWQGIDVPGASVRLVIMDKIPFPNPQDPFVAAMFDALGFELAMKAPAAMQLAQGAGRLVRSQADRGLIAVLDPRVGDRDLARALPDAPHVSLAVAISFLSSNRPSTV